jgi:UMF1 family MFS transporter
MTNEYQFYGMAFSVGLLMGGIQSLSRSTYSKLIPEDIEDTTSFFSFYDVTEKVAIVIGLFSFGLIEQMTQNIRYSALFLAVYFIIGFLLLFRVLKFNKLQIIQSN